MLNPAKSTVLWLLILYIFHLAKWADKRFRIQMLDAYIIIQTASAQFQIADTCIGDSFTTDKKRRGTIMIFNVGPSGSRSIEIIANGTSYRYIGTEISNDYFKISPNGDMGWKLWIYATVDIKFNYLVNVDIFAVGKGGNGAGAGGSFEYGYYAGGGGSGGTVVTMRNVSVNIASAYSVVVGNDATTIADLGISAPRGGNANGRSGGTATGTSAWGGGGRYINDHTYPATNIPPDSGGGGYYAFGESSFDGVQYANGGGGGDRTPETRGKVYTSRGSGGAGGCSSVGPTSGIDGIVCMRNAS